MKKAVIIVTILSVLFSSIVGVAADSSPKDIEVILSDTPAVVNLGDTVEITAAAPKHGSNYAVNWENAIEGATEFDLATETYTSKATFKAEKPGVYVISCTIKMTSGSSDTVFFKRIDRTIEVMDHKIVGAAIKDLSITPIYNTCGSVAYYMASGTIYALWSDKTETPNGSVFLFFGPNEVSKDINVTLDIEGNQYDYVVTVTR